MSTEQKSDKSEKSLRIGGVSPRYLSGMTKDELKKELKFIDNCNPSNKSQLGILVDYASKIKAQLNVR